MRPGRPISAVLLLVLCGAALAAQKPPAATDLDAFMARALQRRDIDRKTLGDYVLDESETMELLAAGGFPVFRSRRDYTWYVRDGFHIRSPLKVDGVPVPEDARRAYEERWLRSEQRRREFRTKRDEKRAQEGKPPAMSVPAINEPRFVSESYFMDFKFEPGNYFLAGKEQLDGHEVLKIDYLPTKMFSDSKDTKDTKDTKEEKDTKERRPKDPKRAQKEKQLEEDIDRKFDKTSQVTLWVDPVTHQIVKYTFDNVWLDFLPVGWIVKIDDLRASMQMGQPFAGVWLPSNVRIHAGVTMALGSLEAQYRREFSNYRRADVTSKVSVPKKDR